MGTWTPDTCGYGQQGNCQIELADDGSWNYKSFLRVCPDHASLATDQERWDAVTGENQRGSSNTLWEILQNAPTSIYDVDPASGTRTFKRGITASAEWSGTIPNRILNITITGFTPTQNQINSIKNKLDTRFGLNNVNLIFTG